MLKVWTSMQYEKNVLKRTSKQEDGYAKVRL